MRRAGALLCLLLAACASSRDEKTAPEHAAAARATVPGVETAVAATEPVRDSVRVFASVVADVELADVRDALTQVAQGEAKRRLAEQQVNRLEELARGAVAPLKELEAARADATSAAAEVERARKTLAGFGVQQAGAPLVTGETWVIAHVPQGDVGRLVPGAEGAFAAEAFADHPFPARVDAAPSYVDPATRAAPVRVRVRDPDRLLRPGMTGVVALDVGAPHPAVVVPLGAVVYDDAQPVVFVAEADDHFSLHVVRLGVVHGDRVEIASGLEAGARVAVTGAASLLSATRLPPPAED